MEPRGPRTPIAISLGRALLIALVLLVGACEKSTDPSAALRTFFEQIAAGKTQQAYESTSFGFQAGQNQKAFDAVVRDLGFMDYQSLQFETPRIEGSSATIRLEISTRAGKRLPFIVTMTNETGSWRVFTIQSPRAAGAGVAENPFSAPGKPGDFRARPLTDLPKEKEVRRLVRESLLAFDQAVADRSFEAFYDTLSFKWQDQVSAEQLERMFKPFVDQQFRISGVADTEAVFDHPPFLDDEGLLVATGYYPTKPYPTTFFLKFTYELPKWKLSDIGKSAAVSGSTVMGYPNPNDKDMRALIRETLLAFDQAVATRSFKALHGGLSAKWRSQITESQLRDAFQPFLDHQYRVSEVANTEAILDRPPALDSEGMLVVSGYYPTHPFKTVFSLKFMYELPNWKLFGIDVNLQE